MMSRMRLVTISTAMACMAGLACAQTAISAKSGLVHYSEGKVLLDGAAVEGKTGAFRQMKDNSELRTAEEGRAEVLLTPGVFLRVGENSAVRMLSSRLADTRIEVVSGFVLVECAELLKDNGVTLVYKDNTIGLQKSGVYRIDTDPATLRVYDGEAMVTGAGQQYVIVKKGRLLPLNGLMVTQKFDPKVGDAFLRWAGRRSEYLAMANITAAKSIRDSGGVWDASGWRWNPYFGMYTFVPYRGAFNSFWGYRYWSPREVYVVYQPVRVAGGGGMWGAGRTFDSSLGYSTMGRTSAGTSGTMASAPVSAPAASSGAAAAPVSRSGGHAGGRGR